jgi:hypothetical protein
MAVRSPQNDAARSLDVALIAAHNSRGTKLELSVGVFILIVLLGIAFAAGYFTRAQVSRKRHAEARLRHGYIQPDWLNANAPANTNEVTDVNKMAPPAPATSELGQMLNRWESRARARRAG